MSEALRAAGIATRSVRWSVEDRVGTLLLDRPGRRNALTFEIYAELRDLFRALAAADDVRAVVFAGEGADFCSGGDVHEIIGPLLERDAAGKLAFTQMTGDVVKAMRACPQPIVVAVDGVAVGAGAVLALAADVRIGTARSRVGFLFPKVGLSGADMGACALLPRVVGLGRAAELLFTGRLMDGEEAARLGFFTRLVGPETLRAEAASLARAIADGPWLAHATTKKMLGLESELTLDAAIDAEAREQARLMDTQDFARAYQAFVERRPPRFEGD